MIDKKRGFSILTSSLRGTKVSNCMLPMTMSLENESLLLILSVEASTRSIFRSGDPKHILSM